MKVLEHLLCRILGGDNTALIEFIEVAAIRYTSFAPTLQELLARALHQMSIDVPQDKLRDIPTPELIEQLSQLLLEYGEGKVYKVRTTRELKKLSILAVKIARTAVLAAADMYDIHCNTPRQQGEGNTTR